MISIIITAIICGTLGLIIGGIIAGGKRSDLENEIYHLKKEIVFLHSFITNENLDRKDGDAMKK